MKQLLFLVLLVSTTFSYGQTVEERIAEKACECLRNETEIDDEKYRNCVSKYMAEVILQDSDPKVRETFNNVEGIKSMWEKVNATMTKDCQFLKNNTRELKSEGTYSKSKIELAQGAYLIAKDLMQDKKYKLAIEGFEIAIKRDKNFVLAYDDMALCYRLLDDLDKAIRYYKRSLELYPEGSFALVNIGVAYSLKSDYKTAIKYYEKMIEYYPTNAEGYYGAGKNYAILKEYENGLNNLFTAHRIYKNTNSEYVSDSNQIIAMVFDIMKKEGKEELFKEIAKKNNIELE